MHLLTTFTLKSGAQITVPLSKFSLSSTKLEWEGVGNAVGTVVLHSLAPSEIVAVTSKRKLF